MHLPWTIKVFFICRGQQFCLYLNTMQYDSKEPQISASNITNFSIYEGKINAWLLH